MNTSIAIPDRRLTERHTLRIPLRLRIGAADGRMHRAESIDLSGRGALLETELLLPVGSTVELQLRLPEEITGQPTTEWRCKGQVVRVGPRLAANGRSRVGVRFESLDVSRL